MDYEKKYKELVGKIEKAYLFAQTDSTKAVLEEIHPELKESEDEKIRKAIHIYLDWLDGRKDYAPKGEYTIKDMIAWIKKQGEHANFRNKIEIGDKVTRNEDGVLVNLSQLARVAKPAKNQDVQQETLCGKCRKEQPSHSCQDITALGRCAVEHEQKPAEFDDANAKRMFIKALERVEEQNNKGYKLTDCDKNSWWEDFKAYTSCIIEQKPADKVELKFQEGDWAVTDKNNVVQIKAIENGKYVLENTMRFSVDYVDKCWRKWDISDAKDGDVLVFKNNIGGIIICKSPTDYDTRSYCRLVRDNFIDKEESGWYSISLIPATKEQRDTLEKAMADAGYTFDFEKKELKKIVQKPVIEMKTPEESLGVDSDTYNKIVDECVYGEHNPAWSEEDEYCRHQLIVFCENCMIPDAGAKRCANWLKSIKDRYTWKPSEEQMEALDDFIYAKYPNIEKHGKAVKSLYSDLKKL